MIKILKVFVENDTPGIHLLNDTNFFVGEGTINGEKVFMMEAKQKQIPELPCQRCFRSTSKACPLHQL